MKVFITWDGDHIGREVGRARLADDVEGTRKISQAIDLGNKIWQSWVTMNDGSIVSFGGDEGSAEIPAEKLTELPKIRAQYAGAVQSSVSVGVGTKLSEADRALMAAKIRGGDQIVLYTPDVEDEIAAATKKERSESDKLADEYLNKAEEGAEEPALNPPAAGGGMQGPSAPGQATTAAPVAEGSEHSQGEAMQSTMENSNPAPPEMTHAGKDLEDQFHDMAGQQDQKDQGQVAVDPNSQGEQLKAQVVQVLQALKAQAPIMEQVKQSAPDTYQAVMGLAQAVIAMAKQLNGDPQQTSVQEVKDGAASQNQVAVPQPPEKDDKGKDEKKGDSDTKKSEPKSDFDQKEIEEGIAQERALAGGELDHAAALERVLANLAKDPKHYSKAAKELEKASLAVGAGTPAEHHHLNLPVGSQIDAGANAPGANAPGAKARVGRIKVQHENGKQGWVQARAGQILSEDGHPISSRNPGGK